MTRRAVRATGSTTRQRLMPDGAANPGMFKPVSAHTRPAPARLWQGHLSAECSLRYNDAPACPACLRLELDRR